MPMGRWIAGSRHRVALGLGIAIGIRDLRLFGEGNNRSETEVWVSCSVISRSTELLESFLTYTSTCKDTLLRGGGHF